VTNDAVPAVTGETARQQRCSRCIPSTSEKYPLRQFSHSSTLNSPVLAEWVPLGQGKHVEDDFAPLDAEYVPASQG